MLRQVHLFIRGDVIGVGFRAWTKIQAKKLEINGWVKNNFNEVEAMLQGEENKVDEMIDKLKAGPPVSRVDDVEIMDEEAKETFNNFEIVK